MLLPLKNEIEAVASLLMQGGESPEELAKAVIHKLTEMRELRPVFGVVFELTPGAYVAYGPFATSGAARKAIPKIPMAQDSKRGAVFSMYGMAHVAQREAITDAPLQERGDFAIVKEDAAAFRRGWNGKLATRSQYV